MRNLKRVLTLVMAVAMMMSLLVVGAGATFPDQDKIENTDAVNMNVALGIIKGRDTGDFDPTGNVTRGEMAKMIAVALNGGKEPTLGTLINPSYKDIKGHWAEGYIEYCTSLGIVAGMGDGTFAPNANVTATQAAKMLLVAMGYDAVQEKFNGFNWSVNINVRASQKGLYSELAIDPNAPLNRDNAAQMVANALEADMVEYEYKLTTVNGQIQSSLVLKNRADVTILTEKFKLETAYGVLTKTSYNSTDKEYDYTFTNISGKDAVPSGSISADKDFSGLFGQQVKVLYRTSNSNTTVYGMYAYKSKVVATGIADDLGSSTKDGYIKFDGEHYKAEKTADGTSTKNPADIAAVEFNRVAGSITFDAVAGQYDVTLLDVDGDGKVDKVIYLPFTVAKVTYVGNRTFTAGTSYTIANVDVYSGIAKDDFVKIVAANNTVTGDTTFTKIDTVLNGKITSTKNNGTDVTSVMVNGTWYTLASNILAGDLTTYKAKTSISKAPVVNGFICFAPDTSSSASVTDYAVVISAVASANNGMNDDQARLLLSDGTKKVVDTTANYSASAAVGDIATPDYIPAGLNYIGKLVYLEKNSDDEYTLYKSGDVGFVNGFDGVNTGTTIEANTSGAVKYIDSRYVANDATIFLNDNGSWKVITGATLNKTSISSLSLIAGNAFYNEQSNGFENINMALITSTGVSIGSADKQFGYVTESVVGTTDSDGDPCYEITFWNGTSEVKLATKSGTALNGTAKGTVIQYTVNNDGKIDGITGYAMSAGTISASPYTYGVGAVRAYNNSDKIMIALPVAAQDHDGDVTTADVAVATLADSVTYGIDKDDTVILYINTKDVDGIGGGSIALANKAPVDTYAYANVFFIKGSTDLNLLVVDVNNDILNLQ